MTFRFFNFHDLLQVLILFSFSFSHVFFFFTTTFSGGCFVLDESFMLDVMFHAVSEKCDQFYVDNNFQLE